MSPAAARAAESLGYSNVKIYHEGIPLWSKSNPLALTAQQLKTSYLDPQNPLVILDARDPVAAQKGFIPGSASYPVADTAALAKLPNKKSGAPVLVYDDDEKGNAQTVARAIIASGYTNVRVLAGGMSAWQGAGNKVEVGAQKTDIVYIPKPKPGEISTDDFLKITAAPADNQVILDVRTPEETREGTFERALTIPVEELAGRFAELSAEKKTVIYCSTGIRSDMAYTILKAKGFKDVSFLNTTVTFDNGKPEIGW